MLGWIGTALGIVNKLLGAVGWFQKRAERQEYREAGQKEQQLADAKENLRQGRKANDIDAEVARLSDDDLNKRLRKRARPKRN